MRLSDFLRRNAGTFVLAALLLLGTRDFALAAKQLIGSVSECENVVLFRPKVAKPAAVKPPKNTDRQKASKSPKGKGKPPAPKIVFVENECKRYDLLYAGDELEVKEGGKVRFVLDKTLYKTDVPGRLALSAKGVKYNGAAESLTQTEISSDAAKLASRGSLGFSGLGISLKTALRSGSIAKISPVGAAMDENVILQWDAGKKPLSRIALYSETTGRPLIDIKSPSDKLPKPGEESFQVPVKLQVGNIYSYDINATRSGYAVFRILTHEQREKLRAMLADATTLKGLDEDGRLAKLAEARVYALFDVLDKAIELYDALKAKGIDSPDFLAEYDKVVAQYKRYTEPEKK